MTTFETFEELSKDAQEIYNKHPYHNDDSVEFEKCVEEFKKAGYILDIEYGEIVGIAK